MDHITYNAAHYKRATFSAVFRSR